MGENSAIQWTDHTFNPWWGCARISPGCQHCYAEALDKRVGGLGHQGVTFGAHGRRVKTSAKNWQQPRKWNRDAEASGRRARVFCASMADVFETPPNVDGAVDTAPWLLELLDLIATTPALNWLLLTKRPADIRARLVSAQGAFERTPGCVAGERLAQRWLDGEPPANVWLGCTVEDQRRAEERIPELLQMPARVRFLSCEPLLERVDLSRWLTSVHPSNFSEPLLDEIRASRPDWLIIGGESGPRARPFHVEWARELVRVARESGVSPFVKQLGARPSHMPPFCRGWVPLKLKDPSGGDMAEWPDDLRVRDVPLVTP